MHADVGHPRLNIYLPDPAVRRAVKIAAANHGVTLSEYCTEAIEARLAEESGPSRARTLAELAKSARALDDLRRRIGPVGVAVSKLIAEGRRR